MWGAVPVFVFANCGRCSKPSHPPRPARSQSLGRPRGSLRQPARSCLAILSSALQPFTFTGANNITASYVCRKSQLGSGRSPRCEFESTLIDDESARTSSTCVDSQKHSTGRLRSDHTLTVSVNDRSAGDPLPPAAYSAFAFHVFRFSPSGTILLYTKRRLILQPAIPRKALLVLLCTLACSLSAYTIGQARSMFRIRIV